MRIISPKESRIGDVIEALKHGATLVYPTETCYGLGCDATNVAAVEKMYAIKGRPEGKSLIVIVASLEMMAPYIEVTPTLRQIEKKYWPGAMTVVVESIVNSGELARGVVSIDGTVAFRVTSHPFARALVTAFGRPLVSTSANLSGEQNLYSAIEVEKTFQNREYQPDVLIDAGVLPITLPSTVIRVAGTEIEILRQGEIIPNI